MESLIRDSIILQAMQVRLTGLYFPGTDLFPFLWIAVMFPVFHCVGVWLVLSEELNIIDRGVHKMALNSL